MAGVAKQPGLPQSGPRKSNRGQSNSHIVALLSLKILLLAFFILLNSLATFEEERRVAVVDSVRNAFDGVLPAQLNLDNSPAAIDVFDGAEQVVDELHKLFADDLPLLERAESSGSQTLRVDLPESDIFAEGSGELLSEGAETLRLIAAVLEDPRFAGARYRVDILYGLDAAQQGAPPPQLAVTRAGAVVRGLEGQGLDPRRLSTGFLPDFTGQLRFLFTVEQDLPPAGGGEG